MQILNTGRSKKQQELVGIRDSIFAGDVPWVRKRIAELSLGMLSRAERLQLAYLANMAGMHLQAIKLLHRTIRGKRSRQANSTDEERTEYALALGMIGAFKESVELYRSVDADRLPRALVGLSFVLFKIRERDQMIQPLERALRNPDLGAVETCRAKVRLASALIYGPDGKGGSPEDFKRSDGLLEEVVSSTRSNDQRRMHWLALLVSTQGHYLRQRWEDALQCLQRMEDLYMDESLEAYAIYVEQWRAAVEISRTRGSAASLERYARFRAHALASTETAEHARRGDYFKAIALKDRALGEYVYFGTPIEGLRRDLRSTLGFRFEDLPEEFELQVLGGSGGLCGPGERRSGVGEPIVLEVVNGRNNVGGVSLKAGQIQQRLLHALINDFYFPPNNYALFHHLYPTEFFNPESSPVKVRQALKRLRLWFKQARLPLEIVESKGVYRLRSTSKRPFMIRIARALLTPVGTDPSAARLSECVRVLRGAYEERLFGAAEAESALKMSRSSVLTLLRECADGGVVVSEGRGPAKRYRIA